MRGDAATKNLPADEFAQRVNETLKSEYQTHEAKWRSRCEDWTSHTMKHQLAHLDMVRQVLGLESTSEQDLKAQITSFFGTAPWWHFFSSVASAGCMRTYTDLCHSEVKDARRLSNDLIIQKTGRRDMHWHAYADRGPDLSMPQPFRANPRPDAKATEDKHGGDMQAPADNDRGRRSLLQTKQRRRDQVPVELRASGQQVRLLQPRRNHSS